MTCPQQEGASTQISHEQSTNVLIKWSVVTRIAVFFLWLDYYVVVFEDFVKFMCPRMVSKLFVGDILI